MNVGDVASNSVLLADSLNGSSPKRRIMNELLADGDEAWQAMSVR
jgi:hypothetical protein